ncbi:hypothetical protein BH23PAT2_BH23PAT2_08520 [soil metagenome]
MKTSDNEQTYKPESAGTIAIPKQNTPFSLRLGS